MRKAVIAVCTFLTITALCENAMARGAAGVRARPSTVARSHGVAITAHSRGSGYSHVGKVVGWRYCKDHGWRRDQHTRTALCFGHRVHPLVALSFSCGRTRKVSRVRSVLKPRPARGRLFRILGRRSCGPLGEWCRSAFASYRLSLPSEPRKTARPFLGHVFAEHADIGVPQSTPKNFR